MSREFFFDKQGSELLADFCEALEEMKDATERLAQYVYSEHERDRYGFLHKVAHCRDYYYCVDEISKCFDSLSEGQQNKYFMV